MRLMSEPLDCESSLSQYCRFAFECLMEVIAGLFVHVHVLIIIFLFTHWLRETALLDLLTKGYRWIRQILRHERDFIHPEKCIYPA